MRKWLAVGAVAAAAGLSLLPISEALAGPTSAKTVPTITHFHAKPLAFASTGGVLHYSADLTQTKTYTLTVTPTIDRLPRTLHSEKKVSGILRIPANHTHRTKHYRFVLSTWDGVAKRVLLSVRPAPDSTHPIPPPTTTTTRPAPTTTTTTTTLPAPTTTTTTVPTPPATMPTLVPSSVSIRAVNANNPLFNGQAGEPGPACYLYHFNDAVCGSMAVSFQTTTYPSEPSTVSWLVSAEASRTFGCYLQSTATFTPTFTIIGNYDFDQYYYANGEGGNAAGLSTEYFFGNSDIPTYTCPAGEDEVSSGVQVSNVVATLYAGPYGDTTGAIGTLAIPGEFSTPPFTDPYLGDDG